MFKILVTPSVRASCRLRVPLRVWGPARLEALIKKGKAAFETRTNKARALQMDGAKTG